MHDVALIPAPARLLTLDGQRLTLTIAPGQTLAQVIETHIAPELWAYVEAFNHGSRIVDTSFTLRAGDALILAIVPSGGGVKAVLGVIITLIVSYFAPQWAPAVYEAFAGVGAAAAAPGMVAAIGVAGTMLATMALSALIRPPTINTGGSATDAARSYSLSGQSNQARPYGACLVIYGRHKVMPLLAANPNVDNLGTVSQFSAVYDFGLGNVQVEDLRVGDVTLDQFAPQLFLHQDSYCRDLRLNFDRIGYDTYAYELQQDEPVILRTKPETKSAALDIQFPRGLYQIGTNGPIAFWADLRARWRKLGDPNWIEAALDSYLGAATRAYVVTGTPPEYTISYRIAGVPDPVNGVVGGWIAYNPTTASNTLQAYAAAARAAQEASGLYTKAIPNAAYFTFTYPSGEINEADYFARYPEVLRAGWGVRGARAHFESIGSREGRDPRVAVRIGVPAGTVLAPSFLYDPSYSAFMHLIDKTYPDRNVGGWWFIDAGSPLPDASQPNVVFEWSLAAPFDEANYSTRYPDVAAWILQSPVTRTGWLHFMLYGAFEGRDPYVWAVTSSYSVRLTANNTNPYWVRVAIQFPAAGEYEVEIRRTDPPLDGSDSSIKSVNIGGPSFSGVNFVPVTSQVNVAVAAILRSFQSGAPVQPRLRHTMLELRVNATDKLSGVIQNLSAIATSILPTTADGVTFTPQATRNPAWIVLDMLTSEKNPKPLAYAQIDWPSWLHFAAVCGAPRYWVANGMPFTAPAFTCDVVVSEFTTVKDLVESVLTGARASLTLTGAGKWAILLDEEKATPRQLLTPANSWNFTGSRSFAQRPHAFRVNFINRDLNYARDEVLVYADGYDAANADKFETLDTFGITDYPHAWAYGRYMLAQGLQRSEVFTLTLDAENLLVQRGDMVFVAHDVPKVGGIPTRISRTQDAPGPGGGQVVYVALVPAVPITGWFLRRFDGQMESGRVGWQDGAGGFELIGTTVARPDDLLVLGEVTRCTAPYLVQAITPGPDLTASLTLCAYAVGVYSADTGPLPPWFPNLGSDLVNGTDLVVVGLAARQTLYYVARDPFVDVVLTWGVVGWNPAEYEVAVYSPTGTRQQIATGVHGTTYTWTVDALQELSLFGVPLSIEVTPIAGNGSIGRPGYVSITLVPDRIAPAPVLAFGVNVQSENVDLFWTPPNEPDIARYLLRYTPEITPGGQPDWNSAQFLATVAWPTTKTSAGARTGSYGIRVVDTSGNVSTPVWRRTTVAVLPQMNSIETINDRYLVPPWPGVVSNAVVVGTEVRSAGEFPNVAPDGYYYCQETVDLGEVYEARLSSKIQAYAVTADEYMAAWPTLASVPALAFPTSADLGEAWAEVRTIDAVAFIASWPTLDSVELMAVGDETAWSGWRPFMVGDFTAQIFQFRIWLRSLNPGVRVCVSDGLIEVDMPDRRDAYGDVFVPAGGLDFVFPVAFRRLDAVAITINGNEFALVAQVTDKHAEGFRVDLVDSATQTPREGVVDIQVQGYGRRRANSI